jgi:hypothetical protein
MPGWASTTRSVPSCRIYVILAMALARLASVAVLGDEQRQMVPTRKAAGANGMVPARGGSL